METSPALFYTCRLPRQSSGDAEVGVKQKLVWSATEKKKSQFKFLRLNVIEEYNMNMNSTEIADRLWGVYQPDHWMRHRNGGGCILCGHLELRE